MSVAGVPVVRALNLFLVVCGVVTLFLANALGGGHPAALYQPTAALFVAGGCLAAVAGGVGIGGVFEALSVTFRGGAEPALARATGTFMLASIGALGGGALGVILGMIHVMQNLADPSKLGEGVAVAFISAMYAVGTTTAFTTAAVSVARQEPTGRALEATAGVGALLAVVTAGLAVATTSVLFMTVLYATTAYDQLRGHG